MIMGNRMMSNGELRSGDGERRGGMEEEEEAVEVVVVMVSWDK